MTPEALSAWSDLLAFSAAGVYVFALIFYSIDIASVTSRQPAKQRTRSLAVSGPSGRLPQDNTSPDADRHDGGAQEFEYRGPLRLWARLGVSITVLAVGLHLSAVVARGLAAQRVPWGNLYEYFLTGSMVVVGVYLVLAIKRDIRFLGAVVTSVALLMLCAATIGFPTPVSPLIPALQSPWIVIHVSVAALGTAVFAIAFCLAVLTLIKHLVAKRDPQEERRVSKTLAHLPSTTALDRFTYRLNAIGFIMWTFTLIAGAIWANEAWGRYWGWDPKEVWTFITWIVYAAYLHARATRGWSETRAAWITIIGFASIIFNSTVVNTYFSGLHSYSGI
jgi:cytochrome c-type biogenesis protein CcsB